MNWAQPSMPNVRTKPLPGETREKSGFSLSAVHRNPCCMMLPRMPARAAVHSTAKSGGPAARAAMRNTSSPPSPSTDMRSGWAMKGSISAAMLRVR